MTSTLESHLLNLPFELHLVLSSYLRATDLAALQQTCTTFNNRQLISSIIHHFSTEIYPPELTQGFDTPIIAGDAKKPTEPGLLWTSYEPLRNMEMLVVARVISRPEPPLLERQEGAFYVSKAWCRAALRWLEVQADERREREVIRLQREAAEEAAARLATQLSHGSHRKKQPSVPQHGHSQYSRTVPSKNTHKPWMLSKKEKRIKNRRLSDAIAPWPDINADIACPHCNLQSDVSRSKRRVMDKQAWKVLKKLYPDSVQLCAVQGECLQCKLELETIKKSEEVKKQKETDERKKPLSCPLVRAVFSRTGGVPRHKLAMRSLDEDPDPNATTKTGLLLHRNGLICPLTPGVYHALPREWCYRWRKYIKTGEGSRPIAPDSSACLCDGHKLPLIPPHLEEYLYGEVSALLGSTNQHLQSTMSRYQTDFSAHSEEVPFRNVPVGFNPIDSQVRNASQHSSNSLLDSIAMLRTLGLSDVEIEEQRLAMVQLERQQQRQQQRTLRQQPLNRSLGNPSPEATRAAINAELDRLNYIVVEILTDEEFVALEQWWPGIHSSYALKFAVVQSDDAFGAEIVWTTPPCRECETSGLSSRSNSASIMVRSKCKSSWGNTPSKKG